MSAIWRIYPSSKWSSQWPYDGYIRHGRIASCGRGRGSATLECFGRGSQGTIFVRTLKLSLFFPELCSFRRVFLFPALLQNLAPNVRALRLLVSTMSWSSFWKPRSVTRHFLANSNNDHEYFLKISILFSKQSRCYLPDSYGDPQAEQSSLVVVHPKLEWKRDFRALARSSAEGPSIVVAFSTSHLRWSMVERDKSPTKSAGCNCPLSSTNTSVETSEFWGACFRDPMVLPFCSSLFSCRWLCSHVGQAADRGQRRKAVIRDTSGVDHEAVTILSAPIWFTGRRHSTVFRHVMQLSLLVLREKSTLTVILPKIKKKKSLSNVGHRGTKAENFAWHATG